MPRSTSEFENATQLARARWGETGFLCPRCENTKAYRLKDRPRVFQCSRCKKQVSVTSDTVMHGTKLPLEVWVERASWHDANDLPTSRGFARDNGIAPSSAWHLNQRVMAAVDAGQREHLEEAGYLLTELVWRRPKRTPPVPDNAPDHLRDTIDHFRDKKTRTPLTALVAFGFWGREPRLVDVCPSPLRRSELYGRPASLAATVNRGVTHFVRAMLVGRLGTVCLRWAGRYIRYLLTMWSVMHEHVPRAVPWLEAMLSWPKRTLPALRDLATDYRRPKIVPPPPQPEPVRRPATAIA